MGMIEDVMKALDRIPGWKRISDAPRQIDALEQRVAALEARLTPAAGDQCPRCREMAFRLIETVPADPPWNTLGVRVDVLRCSACRYEDRRERTP